MEIKACLWCRGKNFGISDKSTIISYKRKRHVAVYCKDCNCYGPRIIGEEEFYNKATDASRRAAITAWNTRREKGELGCH